MPTQDSNCGAPEEGIEIVECDVDAEFASFDLLHPKIKEIIRYAPIPQTCGEALKVQKMYGPDVGALLIEQVFDKLCPGWKIPRDLGQ